MEKDGQTALHLAGAGGFEYVALALLQHAADVNAQDNRGETALHYAANAGHTETVGVLLTQEHININTQVCSNKNSQNITSFHVGQVDPPSCQDADGVSALHWAALQGHAAVVQLLLQYGAYPNFMETNGTHSTPLDYAYTGAARLHASLQGATPDENPCRQASGLRGAAGCCGCNVTH